MGNWLERMTAKVQAEKIVIRSSTQGKGYGIQTKYSGSVPASAKTIST